jgi:hypothetical protein
MRVLLSTYDSRWGVEPLLGLAVRLRELGAQVRMCAPPDCAERLAEVGVPLVRVGAPVRPLVHGASPPSAADVPRRAAELIAAQFDKLAAAAHGCDALVVGGLAPAAAGARSVAEKLGIYSAYVSFCPIFVPSPHQPPVPLPGRPFPGGMTDNRVLHELDVESYNALFGEALNTGRTGSACRRWTTSALMSSATSRGWRPTRPCPRGGRRPTSTSCGPARGSCRTNARSGRVGGIPGGRPAAGVRRLRQHARPEGHRPGGHPGDPGAGPLRSRVPRLGRLDGDRRPGRLCGRRRGQPAATVPSSGRCRAPRWCGHDDNGRPGGRA